MPPLVLVAGGAGYIGAATCGELIAAGFAVRVLDSLLHGQAQVAADLTAAGVDVHAGDIRDPDARRRALAGVDAVVNLAAIVGDPACAQDPDLADAVNVQGARALIADAAAAGASRFVFASTCSNYGRMADPSTPVDETATLAPVSLYAEQKVQIEGHLQAGAHGDLAPSCLRFATIYGVAPRMRFDLTVNEFTRDLFAGRTLDVFGEQFWRPYVHVFDAARAIVLVLRAPREQVGGRTFNVGHTDENYRKLDLVEELRRQTDAGEVRYVTRTEDPRDYKVDFSRIRDELGFRPQHSVPDGIGEIAAALAGGAYPDPWDRSYRNSG